MAKVTVFYKYQSAISLRKHESFYSNFCRHKSYNKTFPHKASCARSPDTKKSHFRNNSCRKDCLCEALHFFIQIDYLIFLWHGITVPFIFSFRLYAEYAAFHTRPLFNEKRKHQSLCCKPLGHSLH